MTPRYLMGYWIAILTFAAAASGQVSSDASLSGQYYFRQVLLITDSTGTNVTETRSGFGLLIFDGKGKFTINGLQLIGTAGPTALTTLGLGTYAVKAGGSTTLSNPLLASATINARLGAGALVGSSTEAGSTIFDFFLAIPVPATPVSLSTLNGPYWISSLEFPDGGTANIRNTNFKLTANGAGSFAETTVTGQARNLGNVLSNQTISPITYLVSANAEGRLSFPLGMGQTNLTQLISGNKDIYISQDGSYFIGGSTAAGGHGLVVGVKAFASGATSASWKGFFYGAGMRFDADRSRLAAVSASVNVTGSGAVWARRTHQSDGLFDAALLLTYSLGADGSGTYQSTTGHVDLASTGQMFATSGVDTSSSNSYELYFGARMPAQSGSGVFLDPQRVLNAANFALGYPLSPGGFVALFGSGFGTQTLPPQSPPYPNQPAGVQVTVNGVVAPIYSLSPTQISAVVPYSVSGPTATVVVTVNGAKSNSVDVPLAATVPGVYSWTADGLGDAIVGDLNGVKVDASNPAVPGKYVTVYMTGLGAVTPPVPEGAIDTVLSNVNAPVAVTIGGVPVSDIQFKGLAPTLGSVYVMNVKIPFGLARGPQSLAVQTAEGFTDMVNIFVSGPN